MLVLEEEPEVLGKLIPQIGYFLKRKKNWKKKIAFNDFLVDLSSSTMIFNS